MFKKYLILVFFAHAALTPTGLQREFDAIRAPMLEEDLIVLENGDRNKIEAAIEDIASGRTTSNYRMFTNSFGEYTFRNGYRLYFARRNGTVAILGYKFKKNENKQSAHIQEMLNRLESLEFDSQKKQSDISNKDLHKNVSLAFSNNRNADCRNKKK